MKFSSESFVRRCSGLLARCSVLWMVMLTMLPAPASAHDHFLWADRYQLASEQPATVQFQVGHAGDFAAWPHGLTQVSAIATYGPSGFGDWLHTLGEDDVQVQLKEPGTYVVALTSYRSTSELPGERFDAYVSKEGLAAIAAHRERAHQPDQPGTELYARRAKALLQVGEPATAHATQRLGMELEIVPLRNPYSLKEDDALPVQVWYRGKPLAGAQVELEHLTLQAIAAQSMQTDDNGIATFPITKRGEWKLNVVWGVPMAHRGATYSTVFSSLTFGY
ncbi:MAG: DUF4198 domain-containing protein [Pseudomonadota bacterium]